MKYKLIFCFLVLFLASLRITHAAPISDSSDPINDDIVYILPDEHDNVYGYFIKRFDSYAVGTGNAYVYNNGGGTSSTAGAIKIRGMTNKVVQINITNMSDAGTNTIGFFMANGTTTPTLWSLVSESIFTGTVTSAGTVAGIVSLSQMGDYDRIGIRRSGTSSADFTIKESYTRESK